MKPVVLLTVALLGTALLAGCGTQRYPNTPSAVSATII